MVPGAGVEENTLGCPLINPEDKPHVTPHVVYMCVYIYVCVCLYIYIYIYVYVKTYTFGYVYNVAGTFW